MEYVITIGLTPAGTEREADALVDAFVNAHSEVSPVVGEEPGVIDVTFSVEASGIEEAIEAAKPIAARGLAAADAEPERLVSFHLELAPDRELQHA